MKFLILGAREGLVLTVREEKTEKFVDTGEKWVFEICTFFELLFLRKTIETLVKPNFSKSRIQVQVRFFTVTARKTEGDVQVWKETEQIRRRNVGQVQSLFSFFFLKGKESRGRIASSCCWRPRRAIFFGCWKRAVLARFERYWRSTVYISSSCERQYFQNCRIRWYSGERIKTSFHLFLLKNEQRWTMHAIDRFYSFKWAIKCFKIVFVVWRGMHRQYLDSPIIAQGHGQSNHWKETLRFPWNNLEIDSQCASQEHRICRVKRKILGPM